MNWDFQQWLIIALFVSLFFKDEAKWFLRSKLGLKNDNDELQAGMNYLKMHFNDELTSVLTTIQIDQKEGFKELKVLIDGLDDQGQQQCNKLIAIMNKHSEWDRYGIKCLPAKT